ncbi:MAG: hypothetical protein ACSHXK_14915 [Oceanococcus sp.]
MIRLVFVGFLLSSLMACSVRTCELEGAYLEAQEYPDLQKPGQKGELPARDPAYQLPPIPDQEYKAGRSYTNAEGKEETDCLDRPPRLIPKQS